MGDADSNHNPPSRYRFPITKPQDKSFRCTIERYNEIVFQLGDHSLLEGKAISAEGLKSHRKTQVGIFNPALATKLFKSEVSIRIVNVRGKAVRLEHHAFRHVRQPTVHGTPENTEWDTAMTEMRSY